MQSIWNRTFVVLSLTIALGTLADASESESAIKSVNEAEKQFSLKHDNDVAVPFKALANLMEQEKKLLRLESAKSDYLASSVYVGSTLENKFRVVSIVADDTIHVTEDIFTPIKCVAGEELAVKSAWQPADIELFDFYLGDPAEMHQSGYTKVRFRIACEIMLL
jgi:hypothetical protein